MFLKRLFYASAATALFALSYHLGVKSSDASVTPQAQSFAVENGDLYVMTASGDLYYSTKDLVGLAPSMKLGNYWKAGVVTKSDSARLERLFHPR